MRRPRPLRRLGDRRRSRRAGSETPTPPPAQPASVLWFDDDASAPFAEPAAPLPPTPARPPTPTRPPAPAAPPEPRAAVPPPRKTPPRRRGDPGGRRLVLGLLATYLLVIAAVAGTYLLLRDSGSRPAAVSVGGSRFGPAASSAPRKQSLLDALAPVLASSSGGSVPNSAATHVNVALPVARAVAQLFVVGFAGTGPNAPIVGRLRERDWGGVVVGAANYQDPGQLRQLVDRIAAAARAARHTPPLLGARQAGDSASAFAGLAPASEAQLGAGGHPAAVQDQAIQAARVLRALHLNMNLAPDGDLGYQGTAIAARAFSADATIAARLTLAALRGYRQGGVIPVLGHFPGEGAASSDPQESAASVGLTSRELRARDEMPFAAALSDAPIMQMSDAVFAGLDGAQPATLSPAVIGLLRDGLHYRGLVMSGDLSAATAATGGNVGQAAVSALQAGADLLYVSGGTADSEEAYGAVLGALRQGQLSERQLALAVARILALKRAYGLLG